MDNCYEENEEPPSNKGNLHIWAGFLSSSFVALGYLLRQWANSKSMGDIQFIRNTGNSGRLPLLVDF